MIDMFPSSSGINNMQLLGQKVRLRPAEREDWAEWVDLRQESRDFLVPWEPTWPHDCLTRGFWQRRLKYQEECWRQDIGYHFLIFCADSNKMIGGISLSNVRRGVNQSAVLGYWIGKPHIRQGYALDSVTTLLDHSFTKEGLKLHRVEAGCLPRNAASRGLLQKAGFFEEGIARGYLRINGVWEDHLMYSILEGDWANRGRDANLSL